jgi:hypothetical protein
MSIARTWQSSASYWTLIPSLRLRRIYASIAGRLCHKHRANRTRLPTNIRYKARRTSQARIPSSCWHSLTVNAGWTHKGSARVWSCRLLRPLLCCRCMYSRSHNQQKSRPIPLLHRCRLKERYHHSILCTHSSTSTNPPKCPTVWHLTTNLRCPISPRTVPHQ